MNPTPKLPVFAKVIVALALPASAFRLYVALLIIMALMDGATSGVPIGLSWAEALTGFMAGAIGISGTFDLLARKTKGITACWACIGFNAANIAVSFITFMILPTNLEFFDIYGMGMIRIAFTVTFACAVIQASKVLRKPTDDTPEQEP